MAGSINPISQNQVSSSQQQLAELLATQQQQTQQTGQAAPHPHQHRHPHQENAQATNAPNAANSAFGQQQV